MSIKSSSVLEPLLMSFDEDCNTRQYCLQVAGWRASLELRCRNLLPPTHANCAFCHESGCPSLLVARTRLMAADAQCPLGHLTSHPGALSWHGWDPASQPEQLAFL